MCVSSVVKHIGVHIVITLFSWVTKMDGGREYVMWGARIVRYGCLSLSKFNLKNKWDWGEAVSLNVIRMVQMIAAE